MADPTLKTALADPKLRPVVLAWATRTFMIDEVQFIVDMLQKRDAGQIYREYIAEGSPKLVNLPSTIMNPIRALVAKGKFKPTELRSLLVTATEAQFSWLNGTFASGTNSFLTSQEYRAYQTAGLTRDPSAVAVLTSLALPASKASALEPLLKVYFKPRSVEDAYQAYQGMQKVAAKAKLDVALKAAGKPADAVVRDYQVAQLVEALKPSVLEAKRYFETALKTVKAKGKPGNPIEVTRMFNSGRQRAEKVTTVYTKAVRLDPGFASKHSALAADKKKVDEGWAAYRKALGK
jgi:hypothetical protein